MFSFMTQSTSLLLSWSKFENILADSFREIRFKGGVFLMIIVIVSNSVVSKTLKSYEAIHILSVSYSW
jgi:hypothetical protein